MTIDIDNIDEHYYTTHSDVTPHGLIAIGPDLDFASPHARERLGTIATLQ